ncbi:MAG TPA: hypothetical protein VFC61_11965 [Blastocatellia bacterium]|jgi:hypothetical protein|nr:hypothetical protein [Blastocatellia bacterium]
MIDEEVIRQTAARVAARLAPAGPTPAEFYAPWTGEPLPAMHPSRQQFQIQEASESPAARELLEFIDSQHCTVEKDKPCDHCGLCRSLGF